MVYISNLALTLFSLHFLINYFPPSLKALTKEQKRSERARRTDTLPSTESSKCTLEDMQNILYMGIYKVPAA